MGSFGTFNEKGGQSKIYTFITWEGCYVFTLMLEEIKWSLMHKIIKPGSLFFVLLLPEPNVAALTCCDFEK